MVKKSTIAIIMLAILFVGSLLNLLEVRVSYNSLKNDKDKLQERHDILESKYNSLKSEYDLIKKNYDKLRGAYDALKAANYDLEKAYSKLKEDSSELNSLYQQLLKNHSSLDDAYSSLLKDYTELEKTHRLLETSKYILFVTRYFENNNTKLIVPIFFYANDYAELEQKYRLLESSKPTLFVTRYPDISGDYVCDGVSDEVEIQAAINSLPPGGGVVYFKEGTYEIKSPISPVSNLSLVGTGSSSILRLADGANSHMISYDGREGTYEGIVIRGLVLDGNQAKQTAKVNIIYLSNVTSSAVLNCTLINAKFDAIYLKSAERCLIAGNLVKDSYEGINLASGSYYNKVVGNYVINTIGQDGIEIQAGPGTTSEFNSIMGNIVKGSGKVNSGIDLYKYAHHNIILGNIVYDSCQGVTVERDSNHNILLGNYIHHIWGGTGLEFVGESRYNIAIGNQANNCYTVGILTDSSSTENFFYFNNAWGNSGANYRIKTDNHASHNTSVKP